MTSKWNKLLLLLLAAALIFSLASATALADPVTVTTWSDLQTALNAGGEIELGGNIRAADTDTYLSVTKTATLDLKGFTIDRNLDAAKEGGAVIYVQSGGSLTINDSSKEKTGLITGGKCNDRGGGIRVDGTLIMNGGTIRDNLATSKGGGIYIIGGTVTLNEGAAVKDNTSNGDGGGVYIIKNGSSVGKLTINGGEISGNKATTGGGVYVRGSEATFEDGKIVDNKTSGNGGGVAVFGETGTKSIFTMNGGEISGNESQNGCGGVYYGAQECTFNLYGGTITGNKSSMTKEDISNDSNSFGVSFTKDGENGVRRHTFNVQGAPQVYGNTAGTDAVPHDVNLTNLPLINVTNPLGNDAKIGVYNKEAVEGTQITSGLDISQYKNAFFSNMLYGPDGDPNLGVIITSSATSQGKEAFFGQAYAINVKEGQGAAYHTVNDEEPITAEAPGNYVYLKPAPKQGKYVKEWYIVAESEGVVDCDMDYGRFLMPNNDVKVEAVYASQQEYVIDLTAGDEAEIAPDVFDALCANYEYEVKTNSDGLREFSFDLDKDDAADMIVVEKMGATEPSAYCAKKATTSSIKDYIFKADAPNITPYWPIRIVFKNYTLTITKTWDDRSDAGGRRPDDLSVTIEAVGKIATGDTYTGTQQHESYASISVKPNSETGDRELVVSPAECAPTFASLTAEAFITKLGSGESGYVNSGCTVEIDGQTYPLWMEATDENSADLFYVKAETKEYTTDGDSGEWIDNGDDTWTYEIEVTALAVKALVWEALPEYYKADKGTSEDDAVEVDLSEAPAAPAAELTNYREIYTITVVSGTSDKADAMEGETVTATGYPLQGHTFTEWKVIEGDVTLSDPTAEVVTFEMPYGNVVLQAVSVKDSDSSDSGSSDDEDEENKVNVIDPDNGDVSVDPEKAAEGDKVTIEPEADPGYEVDDVKVYDEDGKEVPVTDNGDGTYSFTMPDGPVAVNVTFKDKDGFSDVGPNDWFYDAVLYAVDNGLMNGVGGDLFAPNAPTTRAMIVTILYRMEGEPDVEGLPPFSDTVPREWYIYGVKWASDNGIVAGFPDGTFKPDDLITREQFVTILYRYAQYKGYDVSVGQDTNILSFNDAFEVSDWANAAVCWAVGAGLMQGDDKGNLNPQAPASRAEAAALFQRFAEKVK